MEHKKMSLRTRGRRLMNFKQPLLGLASGECCTLETSQYEVPILKGKVDEKVRERIYMLSTSSESDENVPSKYQSACTVPCCEELLAHDRNHNVVGIDVEKSSGKMLSQPSRTAAPRYSHWPAAAKVIEVDRCDSPMLSNSIDLTGGDDDDDEDGPEKILSCAEPEMSTSVINGCVQKRTRKILFGHTRGVLGAHPVFCRQFYSDCEIYHESGSLPTSVAVYCGRKPSFWLELSSAAESSSVTQTDVIMQRKYCQPKNLRPSQMPFRAPPGVSSEEHRKKVVQQMGEWSLMLARQGVPTCRKDVVRSELPWIPVAVKKCKVEVDENFTASENGSPAGIKSVRNAVHCLRPVRVKETDIMKSNLDVGDAAETTAAKNEKLLEACEIETHVSLPQKAVSHHSIVTDVQIIPSLSLANSSSEKTTVAPNQTCGQGSSFSGDGILHRNQKAAGSIRAGGTAKSSDSVAKMKRSSQSKSDKAKQEGKIKGKPYNRRRKNEEQFPSLRERIIDHFPVDYNDLFTDRRHSDEQEQAVYEFVDEESPCVQRRRPVHNRAEYLFDQVQAGEHLKEKENGGRTMDNLQSDMQNNEVCSTTGELEACSVSSPYRKRTARRNLTKLSLPLAVAEHDDIDDFSDAGSAGAAEAIDPTYRPAMKKGRKTEGSQAAKNKATIQQLPAATERNVTNGRRRSHIAQDSASGAATTAQCPVCSKMQPTSEMNSHLDVCLLMQSSAE